MNNQQPMDVVIDSGRTLLVHSIFYSLQGEGPFVGWPAVFIRLAGCNLACPFCDTDYTVGAAAMSVDSILREVRKLAPRGLVVLTGGEPYRQPIQYLVYKLRDVDYHVQIETNGTMYQRLNQNGVTIVCSPKTSEVHKQLRPLIGAFKYLVRADQPVDEQGIPVGLAGPSHRIQECPVYIQPLDEQNLAQNYANQQHAVKLCLKHGFILCLQIHKIVGVA